VVDYQFNDKWEGGTSQNGTSKTVLANEIIALIMSKEIQTQCATKDILHQVQRLEKSFRSASDSLNQAGVGSTDEKRLKENILQKCPYYYELYDIKSERSSTMPIALFDSMQPDASVNIREERHLDDSNRDKVVPEVEKSLIIVFGEKMGTTIGDTELVLKCGGCCQPWHYTPHDCSGCGCPMHTWCGAPAVEWEEGHGAHHKCPLCSSMKNPKTPASKSGVSTT